ncbi:AT-hook motif nuclear-localized protein 9-like [Rhodamnia argentea]|uniref:AT-hook motif nuclear-localized protein n=1 Tax=Rhodamnia argentea TaxID=178133 RepID=A0A8B8NFF3_9MYRT|nr:AT-hook motif nuclear-localized protein 9-like [Rhodamnia argentea]
MDMPSQTVGAEGVKKEDSDETLSSPEATVAADAGAGGERVLALKPEPSTVGKRKRGRPRKTVVDETMMGPPPAPAPLRDAAASRAAPPHAESSSAARHGRGRPKKAFKIKLMQIPPTGLVHNLGSAFKPLVLTVPVGRDIIQELSSYVQDDDTTLVPFSATGEVSSITFYSSDPDGEKTHYEGRFVINVLQGSLNRKYGMLSLMMTDPQGRYIGGTLAGPLVAGNHVQIIFGTYNDIMERKNKRKQRSANAFAAAAAQTKNDVDDAELVDVPVCVGEVAEGNANGSSPGPEGSDEEEPIMAGPITIVPPASSLPEGSDEEEPIMATPITVVPPASSLPATPEDENESVDVCGSDSEK